MAVEVYVWLPSGLNVGHAAIKVTGGSPPGDVYMSAWPKTQLSKIVGPMVNQTYAQDVASEGKAPTTFRLNYLNETAVKAKIDALMKQNTYAILTDNCCSHVKEALDAGLNFALSTAMTMSTGFVSNPFQLVGYCQLIRTLDRHR